MPQGSHISKELKQLIYYFHVTLHKSPLDIYIELFHANPNRISLKYLTSLCLYCRKPEAQEGYFNKDLKKRGGRHPKLSYHQKDYLISMLTDRKYYQINKLSRDFNKEYFSYPLLYIHEKTVWRYIHNAGFTWKVIERRHIAQNHLQRLDFIRRAAMFDPNRFFDMDEMASSPKYFMQRHGYAPKGKKCIKSLL